MSTPNPYSIAVTDDLLADLTDRLARSRLLDDSPRRPRSGMTTGYLRELVASWHLGLARAGGQRFRR